MDLQVEDIVEVFGKRGVVRVLRGDLVKIMLTAGCAVIWVDKTDVQLVKRNF